VLSILTVTVTDAGRPLCSTADGVGRSQLTGAVSYYTVLLDSISAFMYRLNEY